MKREEIPIPPEDVKWLRQDVFGMSLASFGHLWSVSAAAVHRWESGGRKPAGIAGLALVRTIKIARQMIDDKHVSPADAAREILQLMQEERERLLEKARLAVHSEPIPERVSEEVKDSRTRQGQRRRLAELEDLLNSSSHVLTDQERRVFFEIAPRILWWIADSLWVIVGRGRSADQDKLLVQLEQLATEVEKTAVTVSQWRDAPPPGTSEEESVSGESGSVTCQPSEIPPRCIPNQAKVSQGKKDER